MHTTLSIAFGSPSRYIQGPGELYRLPGYSLSLGGRAFAVIFENVGCAAAHAVHNGLSACPGGSKALHGEKVAFGVLCQLAAENAPRKIIRKLMKFYLDVGLPLTLKDLGITPGPDIYEIVAADVL